MNNDALAFFKQAKRIGIGLDPFFSFMENQSINTNFPPHNIERVNEDDYILTIALAGFSKEDIELGIDGGFLIVTGKVTNDDSSKDYVYRGIALRGFEKKFKLGEDVDLISASMKDGMLEIKFSRKVKENKIKIINIS